MMDVELQVQRRRAGGNISRSQRRRQAFGENFLLRAHVRRSLSLFQNNGKRCATIGGSCSKNGNLSANHPPGTIV